MTLRELYEKAAEKWTKCNDDRTGMEWNCTVESEYGSVCFMANDVADPEYGHDRAALIVAAHNLLPELLKMVESIEEYGDARSKMHVADWKWVAVPSGNALFDECEADRGIDMFYKVRAALRRLREREEGL